MLKNLEELWKYRALIWALAVRHIAMRYRGSLLGFFWSFLNPLCLMLVYTLVFKYYIRFDQVNNYTIFLFCGLLPWLWLSSGLIEGTSAIVSGGHLITKSMFPAHILPAVATITTMVNFLLSLPLLVFFMLLLGADFHWTLLLLPVPIAVQFVMQYGLTLFLGALNVHFRDVQHILGNLLTFVFFLCPIIYPAKVVPERFRFTLDLNPLAQLTQIYHALIMDGSLPALYPALYVAAFTLLCLAVGNLVYNHYRESFAELL